MAGTNQQTPLGDAGHGTHNLRGEGGTIRAATKIDGNVQFFGNRYRDGGLSGVIGAIGQTGTGKTYCVKTMIRDCKRVIFFETVRQRPEDAIYPAGFVVVSGLPQMVAFLQKKRRGSFRVVYRPERGAYQFTQRWRKSLIAPRYKYDFESLCRLVMEVQNVVLAVDEVWKFCTPGWMPEALDDITLSGRHYGVTLLYTAQRPQLVCKDLIAITQQFRIFRIQHPGDLDALRGHVPDAALAEVPKLPDYVHVARDEFRNWKVQKAS